MIWFVAWNGQRHLNVPQRIRILLLMQSTQRYRPLVMEWNHSILHPSGTDRTADSCFLISNEISEKFSSNSEGVTEYYWCFKQLRFLQAKLLLYWDPQKPICHTAPHFLLTTKNQLLRSWVCVFPFLEVFIPSASLFPKPFRKYKRFGFPLLKDIVVKHP